MTRVPILVEAVLRAWGTDDPRVLSSLRAENQPGALRRCKAVERRATDAGWPALHVGVGVSREDVTQAVRQLESVDWRWNSLAHHAWLFGRANEPVYDWGAT
jgi:hypothetical protein